MIYINAFHFILFFRSERFGEDSTSGNTPVQGGHFASSAGTYDPNTQQTHFQHNVFQPYPFPNFQNPNFQNQQN